MDLKDWRKLFHPIGVPGLAGYVDEPGELVGGNEIALLNDGRQAYPAMLEAVDRAERSINLETYILRDDRTGRRFADALCRRSLNGIEVRLIVDALGSLELPPRFIQRLRNHGVRVLEYHPVAPWRRRWSWSRRDHRKILVVDDAVAFTGGINICDDHADPSEGGGGWRDAHVRIAGPAAHELNRIFRATWFRETGRWFPAESDFPSKKGGALVRVAANQELLKRYLIRRAYQHAVRRAEKRILIATAYFIPDRSVRRTLYQAVQRGVDVRVLIPSESDVPAVDYASRRLFARHMARGVRLFAWTGPTLHAKTMTADGVWSAVGSYNFTHRSLKHNLEVTVNVLDKDFSGRLEASILADIESSREITPALWKRRSVGQRALERLCYACRYLF